MEDLTNIEKIQEFFDISSEYLKQEIMDYFGHHGYVVDEGMYFDDVARFAREGEEKEFLEYLKERYHGISSGSPKINVDMATCPNNKTGVGLDTLCNCEKEELKENKCRIDFACTHTKRDPCVYYAEILVKCDHKIGFGCYSAVARANRMTLLLKELKGE